jgi:hypothetical protein
MIVNTVPSQSNRLISLLVSTDRGMEGIVPIRVSIVLLEDFESGKGAETLCSGRKYNLQKARSVITKKKMDTTMNDARQPEETGSQ